MPLQGDADASPEIETGNHTATSPGGQSGCAGQRASASFVHGHNPTHYVVKILTRTSKSLFLNTKS